MSSIKLKGKVLLLSLHTARGQMTNCPPLPLLGVTDWSIAQLLTDHWLVCRGIASSKNSQASQPTANNSKPSSNLSSKTFNDNLQK